MNWKRADEENPACQLQPSRAERPRAIDFRKRSSAFLLQKEPTAVLVNRVIGGGAISHVDENYAISQQSSADISQEGSIARSEELIAEMESSDFVVIGTPMHNFTVPSTLKAWIDHVVRARRTFNSQRFWDSSTIWSTRNFCRQRIGNRYPWMQTRVS